MATHFCVEFYKLMYSLGSQFITVKRGHVCLNAVNLYDNDVQLINNMDAKPFVLCFMPN